MLDKNSVNEKLKEVIYPGFEKDIIAFGFVKDIDVKDENVYVELDIVSSSEEVASQLKDDITSKLTSIGAKRVDVAVKQPKAPLKRVIPKVEKT